MLLTVLDLAVRGNAGEHEVLVAVRAERVVVDRCGPGAISQPKSGLQSAIEPHRTSGVRIRVTHDQLGERVLLELGEQVHALGPLEIVEPIGVLQSGQLNSNT